MKAAASSNPKTVRRLLNVSRKPFATNRQGKDARSFAHNTESKLILSNLYDEMLKQQNE